MLRQTPLTIRRLYRPFCTAPSDNFYQLLKVPENFTIDSTTLASRYKQLQRVWHPDKFAQANASAQAQAGDMSARLNQAYDTLRDPSRRARHLLQIRAPDQQTPQLDPAFLTWVVEIREKIPDAQGKAHLLEQLVQENVQTLLECLSDLRHAFDRGDLERASVETAKLQYLRRIEKALEDSQSN